MRRIIYILPLLLIGCHTNDPNAPQIPGLVWRIYVALIVGAVFGFWIGWTVRGTKRFD